ncbi:MAG: hypothetical protein OIF50_12725 [Flavobacteriaceae bacterium]|nr:hypothetical protein [Flavobacteriaceae bacterium]
MNRLFNTILVCALISVSFNLKAQKANLWMTHGYSKFLQAPGVEANYFFGKHIGVQLGVSAYLQDYNPNQIANTTDDSSINFYNANIGLSHYLLRKPSHALGITAGFKIYYGPNYKPLYFYEEGGYTIYFDNSGLRPSYGADMGIFYNFKRISFLIKFDTAREMFRFGIGYVFIKK